MKLSIGCVVVGFLLFVLSVAAQTASSGSASAVVPPVIQFSNVATDEAGNPLTGSVKISFSLYNNATGGEPLWTEMQTVPLDNAGHYSVYVGITQPNGVPISLFTTGQAHWLGVQIAGQAEQTRVFLVSVPYAMKAGDAATIGGLPASAFMLAAPGGTNAQSFAQSSLPSGTNTNNSAPPPASAGTQDYIPLWTDGSGDLGNSILYQSGTTSVGIGTTTPAATLDVNGSVIARGPLQLPSTGTATAGAGFISQPLSLQASAYNGSAAIGPLFQWQTEPSANNTSGAAGTLNLLYGNGSGSPAETGLNIASTGLVTFRTGQTFPGTLTSVTAGTGLTETGSGGAITLSINTTFANAHYPQLAAANTFTKSQTINGNLTLTGSGNGLVFPDGTKQTTAGIGTLTGITTAAGSGLTGGATSGTPSLSLLNTCTTNQVLQWNGTAWACATVGGGSGSGTVTSVATGLGLLGGPITTSGTLTIDTTKVPLLGTANTFTGNQTVTGNVIATTGYEIQVAGTNYLFDYGSPLIGSGLGNAFLGFSGNSTTTGSGNVGTGWAALLSNTTGAYNTAVGLQALNFNTTGNYNTALGTDALYVNGYDSTSQSYASNNTAVGYEAVFNNDTGYNNTGTGYKAVYSTTTGLDNTADGVLALFNNTTGSNNTALGFQSGPSAGNLSNTTAIGANAVVSESNALVLGGTGANAVNVGIGTATPAYTLDVQGTGRFTGNITFAATQTFPGAGTITGVTAGTGLTGGGTSGTVTLNVDTTKIPQLGGTNTFTANQTVNGTVTAESGTIGMLGVSTATSGQEYGLGGLASSSAGYGVWGQNTASGGTGVYGSAPQFGVYGVATGSGATVGVYGSGADGLQGSGTVNGVYGASNTAGATGVYGTAPQFGLQGIATGSGSTVGVYGSGANGLQGSGTVNGVYGSTSTVGAVGVYGTSPSFGVFGNSTGSIGAAGVYGTGVNGIQGVGSTFGVYSTTPATGIAGTYGIYSGPSTTGSSEDWTICPLPCAGDNKFLVLHHSGVWADTNWDGDLNPTGGYVPAFLATADANIASVFLNDSNLAPTVVAANLGVGGIGVAIADVLRAEGTGGSCTLTGGGDAACTGVLKSVVATSSSAGAQRVETYAMQSPENWFEDFGSGTLSNGTATVALDPTFAQTVNTGTEYHVFLTPNGECEGLYIAQKTSTGFEVRELHAGKSSVAFDYRIVAKRVGYEDVRLANVTERFKKQQALSKNMRRPEHPSAEPQSSAETSTLPEARLSTEPPSVPKMPTPLVPPPAGLRPEPVTPKLPPAVPVRATSQPVAAQLK